ncbi:hypothetical protein [Hymenobacter coccineus]|uniref:Transposase IS200-like domain-containing protein n=1 Tax=Hymenobacter coccineus TaxID=1908235 RepID=A0A1G1SZA3_9BACT|nr:hypothetical protein [Hymenobacter coccineus]OGX83953.1 hypothetical protein BEN49_11910 [Hymenobacter coccineus]
MDYQADALYHIYNRGNNGQQLFHTPAHYHYFLAKLRQHLRPICPILAYCLMPNHFHLLVFPGSVAVVPAIGKGGALRSPLASGLGTVLSSFSQGMNQQFGRTGSWFQRRTKAKLVGAGEYPATCFHYIHQNPVRAGLVHELAAWPYSSFPDYAGLRQGTMCDQKLGRELLDLPADGKHFLTESAQLIDPDRVHQRLY